MVWSSGPCQLDDLLIELGRGLRPMPPRIPRIRVGPTAASAAAHGGVFEPATTRAAQTSAAHRGR